MLRETTIILKYLECKVLEERETYYTYKTDPDYKTFQTRGKLKFVKDLIQP